MRVGLSLAFFTPKTHQGIGGDVIILGQMHYLASGSKVWKYHHFKPFL
jgi:hypothetical protein